MATIILNAAQLSRKLAAASGIATLDSSGKLTTAQRPPGGSGDLLSTNNLSDVANAVTARGNLGAGTSSFSGAYADLSGKPTLGTAAAAATGDFATAAQGTDARTPLAHTHAPGDVTGTAVITNDARLSDARTPVAHTHAPADVTGTAVITNDARLSDARAPTAHNQAETTITFTDVTTGNASLGSHGFLQKLPGGTATFLRADGSFASPTAAASISQTEIDFGATGVSEASFVIADAAVSAGSKLIGTVAYVAPTGKDLDELDMDQLDLKFAPGAGQFTLYATALNECLVHGTFKINYQVGA